MLLEMGVTTEDDIARVIREQMNLDMVSLSEHQIGEEVLKVIPDASILKKYQE